MGLALVVIGPTSAQQRGMAPFFNAGGNTWYHHASTAAEGAARGMADVIRSSGAANLMNSEAAINFEQARKGYIENRMNWTNTYFDMRRVNQQARDEMRRPTPTQEQLIRFSKDKLPDRLSPSQLDPVSGSVNWPMLLQLDEFTEARAALEALYADRAKNGYVSPDQYLQIKQITDYMHRTLEEVVRAAPDKYPSSMTIPARKFIDSLSYESNLQPS
jgi:hypothetical protein